MEIKKDKESTNKRKTASGGGRGKKPRGRKGMSSITGGNPNRRNRKWALKRRNDKFRLVRSDKNDKLQKTELDCQIYLDTNDNNVSQEYYRNLLKVLEEQDFILSKENPDEKGSWLKKFWVKSKKTLSSSEVVDRLEKIERGIELKHIDKVQSEVDLNTSQAISNLLESSKEIPNFSTLVGSLLFAKATVNGEPIVFAQTLTQEQLKIVKDNPSLINKPFDLINKMEEIKVKALSEIKQKKLAGN